MSIYVLVCGDSFNSFVIEFVSRDERLGFDEGGLLFLIFKIGHKRPTEILRNIFSIAFFQLIGWFFATHQFLLEDELFLFGENIAAWIWSIICILRPLAGACICRGGTIIREDFDVGFHMEKVLVLYGDDFIPKLNFSEFDQFLSIIFADGIENLDLVVLITFLFFAKTLNILVGTVPPLKIKQLFGLGCPAKDILIEIHVFTYKNIL